MEKKKNAMDEQQKARIRRFLTEQTGRTAMEQEEEAVLVRMDGSFSYILVLMLS